MEGHKGTLLLGEEVVIDGLQVWIENVSARGALAEWHGSFEFPGGESLDFHQPTYRLRLDDGRSMEIIVSRMDFDGAEFVGAGPLE